MTRCHTIALFCGSFPLGFGLSIFILWLGTRWSWLIFAGIFALFIGFALFSVGAGRLFYFHDHNARPRGMSKFRFWAPTIACIALLLSNFLVAGGIIIAVLAIQTCYTVTVQNASGHRVDHARLFGGGEDDLIGSIPPGQTVVRHLWFGQDGQLIFRAAIGSDTRSALVDAYVTNGGDGRATVILNPDGTISVSN